jgi:hypothetical protein
MKLKPRRYDRTHWASGPWDAEPDLVEFRHAGLPCVLRRSPMGVWCGYVGIPPEHPDHGGDYNDVPVEVHGGLTYGRACDPHVACHVPAPGESDAFWWFGFDCGHGFDVSPVMTFRLSAARYRTVGYARKETKKLAQLLATRAR